jgi:hypothetical protein
MESFNKVLSFFLGLVVVIVFIIVLSNRLNIKSKIIPLSNITVNKKLSPTPTPIIKKTISVQQTKKTEQIKFTQPSIVKQETKGGVVSINTIPETGPATPLLVFYSSSALLGFYLKKIKK